MCSNLKYRLEFFDTDTSKSDNPLFICVFTDDCNLLMSTGFIKIHNIMLRKDNNQIHHDEADGRATTQVLEDGATAYTAY